MTEKSSKGTPSSADRFLDYMLDALLERQRERKAAQGTAATPSMPAAAVVAPAGVPADHGPRPAVTSGGTQRQASGATADDAPAEPVVAGETWHEPEPRPSIGMDRLIRRMLIGLVVAVVLINVPVAAHGLSLARLLPDSASLVIRDGLVLKGSGDRIYMLQNEQLRWISSMDAFEHLGLRWEDVHTVDDAFLARFEIGRPLDILLKCDGSPHIYVLREGTKHWIRDIEVFVAEGYVWDDVTFVSCGYLRGLPDGDPIPPDAGRRRSRSESLAGTIPVEDRVAEASSDV